MLNESLQYNITASLYNVPNPTAQSVVQTYSLLSSRFTSRIIDQDEMCINRSWHVFRLACERYRKLHSVRLRSIAGALLTPNGSAHMERAPSDGSRGSGLLLEVRAMQDVISRFHTLRVDATEYACLKAIVLFKSGKQNRIVSVIF